MAKKITKEGRIEVNSCFKKKMRLQNFFRKEENRHKITNADVAGFMDMTYSVFSQKISVKGRTQFYVHEINKMVELGFLDKEIIERYYK